VHLFENLHSILARESEVKHHEVRNMLQRMIEAGLPVRRKKYLVSLQLQSLG
jgi:hypothetical protein